MFGTLTTKQQNQASPLLHVRRSFREGLPRRHRRTYREGGDGTLRVAPRGRSGLGDSTP